MSRVARILKLAQEVAEAPARRDFFMRTGPGKEKGNGKTSTYMADLNARVATELGSGVSEQCICGNSKLCVDSYVPEEGTIIEVELSLSNPHSNLERDILKSVVAKAARWRVDRLVLLGEPGSSRRHQGASSRAFIEWLKTQHGIEVEIRELSNTHEVLKC
jgi:hypothetical protein